MLLCDFCDIAEKCDHVPWDDECEWWEGYYGDDEAVIEYAQEHGMSVSDAVALIKFCCGMR